MLNKKYVENLIKEYKKSLHALLSYESVLEDDLSVYPFGKNIDDCLNYTLELAQSLGFRVFKDSENYYGYVEIGEGKELIGILGHLDVVPSGNKKDWSVEPFALTEKDGKLYGRGVQDDKGPTLLNIYVLKALMDQGHVFNKRIRVILGIDEESLWRSIAKYKEKEEIPSLAYTPDSAFPMIYAEKGLLQFHLFNTESSSLNIKQGEALNAVPGASFYSLDDNKNLTKILDKKKYSYIKHENNLIEILGKSVHSASSDKGDNALVKLVSVLKDLDYESQLFDFIMNEIGFDVKAKNIFGTIEDESGFLTCNIARVESHSLGEKVSIDLRFPVTYSKEEIVNKIKKAADKYDLEYAEFDYLAPLYVPKDHSLIKTLQSVLKEFNIDPKPLVSGGATYGRAIPNCVAYGAILPGREKTEHQVDEYIYESDLELLFNIYSRTLIKLLEV